MSKLEYPRISCSVDKRKKICVDKKKQILEYRKQGLSYVKIAKIMNVSQNTVLYHANPQYAENVRKLQRKAMKKQFAKLDYRERNKKLTSRNVSARKDPEFIAWQRRRRREKYYEKKELEGKQVKKREHDSDYIPVKHRTAKTVQENSG